MRSARFRFDPFWTSLGVAAVSLAVLFVASWDDMAEHRDRANAATEAALPIHREGYEAMGGRVLCVEVRVGWAQSGVRVALSCVPNPAPREVRPGEHLPTRPGAVEAARR